METTFTGMNSNSASYSSPVELCKITSEHARAFNVILDRNLHHCLPLNLQSFQGAVDSRNVRLWWSTDNEISVTRFEIKKSTDAINFEAIGSIKAKNSIEVNRYSFVDSCSQADKSYFYKIKIIKNDGVYTQSGIISIFTGKSGFISAYPNPTTNSFVLSHPLTGNSGAVRILDTEGKPLFKGELKSGTLNTGIDVNRLFRGSYYLIFENDLEKQVVRFSKY
jgi:hypothetical protein